MNRRDVNRRTLIHIVFWGIMNMGFVGTDCVWQKFSNGLNETDVLSIALDPKNNSTILLGTSKSIYQSTDQGHDFHSILDLALSDQGVNFLYISPESTYYLATTNSGLFVSEDRGTKWQKIFSPSDELSRQSLSALLMKDQIYVGTRKGLFYKTLAESTWHKESGNLGDSAIYFLAQKNDSIYAATAHDVYRVNKDTREQIRVFSAGFNGEDAEEFESEEENNLSISAKIKSIQIVDDSIFIATTRGIFQSANEGQGWEKLPSDGLPEEEITSLTCNVIPAEIVIPAQAGLPARQAGIHRNLVGMPASAGMTEHINNYQVYAGTSKGVFILEKQRWLPLYKGMEATRVNFLTTNVSGDLYAATDKGLFLVRLASLVHHELSEANHPEQVTSAASTSASLSVPRSVLIPSKENESKGLNSPDDNHRSSTSSLNYEKIDQYFAYEPTIAQVQQMAVHYADVSREKIEKWKVESKRKALLPSLSLGLDRSASELLHWDSGPNPDNLLKGKDFMDWDVSMTWDLSDLIFSGDQTSIDSRSKLMVELRENILDQITRLYFERRRVQLELLGNPNIENYEKLDKQMRVSELTALIDGLTGGGFSREIRD